MWKEHTPTRKGESRAAGDADAGVSPTPELPVGVEMIAVVFLDFDVEQVVRGIARNPWAEVKGERASNGSNGGSGLNVSKLSKFLGVNGQRGFVDLASS